MLFKNLFDKKKLINWKKPDIIELYRYNIEQNIIDNFGDSTFTCFDKNYEINNQEIKENKIIINIESGYSKWLTKFIEKHKQEINNFSIFNLYFNNTSDYYLNCLANIDNNVKYDFFDIGLYSELRKDFTYFNDDSVYFVYQRNMMTVFDYKKWVIAINEIFRILKKSCTCEFLEYDFKIKNIENNCISYKINKYIEKEINQININIIINEINKKFDNIKIKKIKMPLYKEDIFNGICIENVILGYSQFKDNILKMLKTTYNIVLNYDELKDILIYEWEKEKSYIEFYIICGNKGGFVST